jgi:hypothetical protein
MSTTIFRSAETFLIRRMAGLTPSLSKAGRGAFERMKNIPRNRSCLT